MNFIFCKNSAALYDIAESDDENVHSESESEENFIKRKTVRVFHPENDEIIPVAIIFDNFILHVRKVMSLIWSRKTTDIFF